MLNAIKKFNAFINCWPGTKSTNTQRQSCAWGSRRTHKRVSKPTEKCVIRYEFLDPIQNLGNQK